MPISNFNKLVATPTYKLSDKSSDYTIQSSDAGTIFRATGTNTTITINDSVAIGSGITIVQYGSTPIKIQPASGVTIYVESSISTGNSVTSTSFITTRQQYSKIELVKVAANTWISSSFGIFVQATQPSNPQVGDLWAW